MSPQDIKKAFEERQQAIHSLRELADETRGREMTGEEQETFDRQNADIDRLDESIQSGLRFLEREEEATKARETFDSYGDLTVTEAKAEVRSDRNEFGALLRGEIRSFESIPERRDLTKGSATAGGNIVTDVLYDRVIEKLEEEGVAIAAGATLIQTESGEDILIPTVTSHTSGALVAEGGAIGESDPVFGQNTNTAYKFSAIVEVSRELIEDQGVGNFNVLDFVGDQGGAAVGRAWSSYLSTGTGSSQPQGFINCSAGVTAASATAITANELIDLQHSVTTPYRANASWAMKDSTLKAVRKLVDGNSNYVWQPGLRASQPDELLGSPVFTDTNMDAIATGKKTIVYGDFSRGYIARIAGGVRVESTNAVKFANDLISVRFIVRGGGCLADTNALRHLVQA